MSLGLKRGIVKLADYNPEWEEEFLSEKERLKGVLDNVLSIEHIGSTSIPNIKAKPILDLMIAIRSLEDWREYEKPLEKLGYKFRTDFRENQGHVLFVKGPEEKRTHYLKIAELDSAFWQGHLVFRDALRANPKYREEYQTLKESLVEKHEGVRENYTREKKVFVDKVLRESGYDGPIL